MKDSPPWTALLPAVLLPLAFHAPLAVELDSVIVTATRTAETADETLAPVTVITREDIERQQAQSVQDVLRGTVGMDMTNSGGPGKITSMRLRGTEAGHVLVLIDGVEVGSATFGTTPFQHIPIEQVERIEVVRGPRSSLYGSEAIGGVVQIFTRKGGGKLKPSFSFGWGRYQTRNTTFGISGGGERGWFNLSGSSVDTEGFDAMDDDEPDHDGYRKLSGSLRMGYRFDNSLEVDLHALRADNDAEFDGYPDESESVQQVLGGTLRYSPTAIWQMILTGGKSRDEMDSFEDGVFQYRFDTDRDTVSLQNDFFIGDDHLLTVGADYQDDEVSSTIAYEITSRDNKGVFVQYQGTFADHDLQLSLRRDDNEQFGNHNTGSVAWGYALGENLRVTASHGTAFKAPTFNQLYYPGYGSPGLEPEESHSTELGISGKTGPGRWSVNIYETHIDDLIASDASSELANIGKARIRGFEAMLDGRVGNWDFNTDYTLLDPESRSSGDNHGNMLRRRVRQSLRLDAGYRFGNYTIGGTLLAKSKRYEDSANDQPIGGFTTVDLRAEYRLARDWRLQARIENLFDRDYETAAFFDQPYNQPGRGLFVTVRYQPR